MICTFNQRYMESMDSWTMRVLYLLCSSSFIFNVLLMKHGEPE